MRGRHRRRPPTPLRDARRRRIARRHAISEAAWHWVLEQHPILAGLSSTEQQTLHDLVAVCLREKRFELRHIDEPADDRKLVIATQACLPILGLGSDWHRGWKTIVVLPQEFAATFVETEDSGVVHEWQESLAGEAWDDGPIVLSWEDVEASGWGDGYNVVIHEVSHKLDLLDGAVNGRPPLHTDLDPLRWRQSFTAAYEQLRRRPASSPLDPYAGESPAEFFAVASELFFERPAELRRSHADVYTELRAFYRQDPAQRRR